MNHLTLERYDWSEDWTRGVLLAPGLHVHTLEPPWLDNHPFISCIPNGLYTVRLDTFRSKYENLRIDPDPPNRYAIEFHRGNRVDDTEGCILVGTTWGWESMLNQMWLGESKVALDEVLAAFRRLATDERMELVVRTAAWIPR